MEDVFYEKLELKKEGSRQNNLEHLGQAMQDAANEFGISTPYGSALNRVAQTEFKLGTAEREFLTNSANNTLLPTRRFLEGDMRTIQKERKILQGKRLDLDSCKNRLKKAKTLETQAVVICEFAPLDRVVFLISELILSRVLRIQLDTP